MSLKHTILAMLENGEVTGYGIAKRFQNTYGYFWNASHQQIYQELGKLASDGLVGFTAIEQQGKPDKKVYHITSTGHQELIGWISKPIRLPKVKDDFMVKLVVGHLVDPQTIRRHIIEHTRLHEEKLRELIKLDSMSEQSSSKRVQQRLVNLAIKRGIRINQSWLEWARDVAAYLDEWERETQGAPIEVNEHLLELETAE